MKKLAFTIDDFDCLNQDHIHLIKEMRKIVMPDNAVLVVLLDDYAAFVKNGKFPIQDLPRRQNNIQYFVRETRYQLTEDPTATIEAIINKAKEDGLQPIYVAYGDNKEFKGRDVLKKHNVPVRFIKRLCQHQE